MLKVKSLQKLCPTYTLQGKEGREDNAESRIYLVMLGCMESSCKCRIFFFFGNILEYLYGDLIIGSKGHHVDKPQSRLMCQAICGIPFANMIRVIC